MKINCIKYIIIFWIICLSNYSYAQESLARDYLNLKPTPTPDLSLYNIQYKNQGFFQIKATPTPVYLVGGSSPTATPTALYSHGREPTDTEWANMSSVFTNLKRWETRITGESTSMYSPDHPLYYNCHRYAIHNQTSGGQLADDIDTNGDFIIEPDEFDNYLEANGFTSCTTNDPDRIVTAYMAYDDSSEKFMITHSSRKFSSDLDESKLGPYERITHPRDGLDGDYYGLPTFYYEPKP